MSKRNEPALTELVPGAHRDVAAAKVELADLLEPGGLDKFFESDWTHDDYATACEAIQLVAQRHDELDGKRKLWTLPIKRVAKDIDRTFKPVLDVLKKTEARLRESICAYRDNTEERRDKLLASMSAEGTDREKVLREFNALEAPEVAGVGVQVKWVGEVVDPDAIPREFLVPDLKALQAATDKANGDPGIPGWKVGPTTTIRVNRKGS